MPNQNIKKPSTDLIQKIIDTFTRGQKNDAIIKIEELIKDYPLEPLLLNISGSFHHSDGKLNTAIIKFKQALKLNSNYPEAHYNLGVTLRDLGFTQEAITSYKNALSKKNEYPDAHYNLGLIFKRLIPSLILEPKRN